MYEEDISAAQYAPEAQDGFFGPFGFPERAQDYS
jgi:hypothetical protein